MQGECRLCRKRAVLRQSHIIPKFVFDWMKASGGPYLRTLENPNIRRQDGLRRRLLCDTCEARFQKLEDWFARQVFHPHMEDSFSEIEYDDRLIRFLISVLWRCLVVELPHAKGRPFFESVARAEEEWRQFLLEEADLQAFDRVHLVFTGITEGPTLPVARFNTYLTRRVDRCIARSHRDCVMFVKFARFVILGEITHLDQSEFEGTRVDVVGGRMQLSQRIDNGHVGSFLIDRARLSNEKFWGSISERQVAKIEESIDSNFETIAQGDMWRAVRADMETEVDISWRGDRKIGRNELCPCGSAKKYKRCHGA